jgi:uncharacterized membrane protein YdbT with pleckstrin-like domain
MLNRPATCPTCGQELKKDPAIPPGIANEEEETEVFDLHPAAMAFLGELILGVLLLPIVVGLILLFKVWYRVVARRYRLTTQRLFIWQGLIAKSSQELELYRVKDVTVTQSFLQRIAGFGSITVLSNDETNPQLTLLGIRNPMDVKETLRTQYRAARRREGVRPTEFIAP